MKEPKVGELAPTFELRNDQGSVVSLDQYRGQVIVLYFFPEAFTGGCTLEACDLRDDMPRIDQFDAIVIGVSVDDPDKLAAFRKEHNLPFQLLSDHDGAVADKYGSFGITRTDGSVLPQARRTTFIIDKSGIIAEVIDPVVAAEHASRVIATLERLFVA